MKAPIRNEKLPYVKVGEGKQLRAGKKCRVLDLGNRQCMIKISGKTKASKKYAENKDLLVAQRMEISLCGSRQWQEGDLSSPSFPPHVTAPLRRFSILCPCCWTREASLALVPAELFLLFCIWASKEQQISPQRGTLGPP